MADKHDNGRVAAIVIALCALVVSIWQMAETRRHNRTTTKPVLCYRVATDPREPANGIFLVNRGLGPAVIKSMQIGGKKVTPADHMDRAQSLAEQAKRYNISFKEDCGLKYVGLESDEIVGAGESIGLVTIRPETIQEHKPDVMMEFFNNVSIVIEYTDLYGSRPITVRNPE
jgi:hypothetical protein